jgi:ATP-dependent helicase HrpA
MIVSENLPVYQQKDKILKSLKTDQVVVVESPTGSGKTTQLPIILHEAGYSKNGVLGITQPRRIAAVSVCEYIASQLDTPIPEVAGYKMRFEDRTTPTTSIKVMTDGILLQELKADRTLSKYSVIMVDEAHERSLNIDFILGLLQHVLEARPEFKVIISSATINAEIFSEYFGGAPIVHIESSMYPVGIIYDPPIPEQGEEGMLLKIVEIISRIMEEKREGDILVFLSGERQIKDTLNLLKQVPFSKKLFLLPLYGRLSKEEQERVFIETPPGKTKVVISTNIAETSVTIDGITSVIDSGLAKLNYYNPRTYTSSLIENPISKASCNQRKGRAGRTRPGTCYRLYAKRDYETRSMYTTEEIYRTDLSEVVLRMAEIGIKDFESFNFISPPGRAGIISAIETLTLLDALSADRDLSSIGEMMALFPLLPRLSRIIVEAILNKPSVIEETTIAVSFLSARTPFVLPPGKEVEARKAHHTFRDRSGDFVSYLKIYRAYMRRSDAESFCSSHYLDTKTTAEIANIKAQLEEIVSGMGIPITSGGSVKDYLCAVSTGLIQFVCANTQRGSYRSLTADRISIHPGSVMFRENPQFIVAGEIVRTSKMFARSVSPLKREWLPEISPMLDRNLLARRKGKGGKPEAVAVSTAKTDQVRVGIEFFPLKPYKGKKKMAVLDWEALKRVLSTTDVQILPEHRKLPGKIRYGKYDLLAGERVSTILKIAAHIHPESEIVFDWPRGKNYTYVDNGEELCAEAEHILKLCPAKKKGKNQLGFICLYTDGIGNYWFTCSRGFHTALSQSLASLEALVDELGDHDPNVERLNGLYRRLSEYLEEP